MARHRNAKSTLAFLEQVLDEMPFSIQRIQTDRSAEFFAEEGQRRLMDETAENEAYWRALREKPLTDSILEAEELAKTMPRVAFMLRNGIAVARESYIKVAVGSLRTETGWEPAPLDAEDEAKFPEPFRSPTRLTQQHEMTPQRRVALQMLLRQEPMTESARPSYPRRLLKLQRA